MNVALSRQVARAGRFGTKGLAITFVSDETDAKTLNDVQDRFEVNVAELPDEIDISSYSKSSHRQIPVDNKEVLPLVWCADTSHTAIHSCLLQSPIRCLELVYTCSPVGPQLLKTLQTPFLGISMQEFGAVLLICTSDLRNASKLLLISLNAHVLNGSLSLSRSVEQSR